MRNTVTVGTLTIALAAAVGAAACSSGDNQTSAGGRGGSAGGTGAGQGGGVQGSQASSSGSVGGSSSSGSVAGSSGGTGTSSQSASITKSGSSSSHSSSSSSGATPDGGSPPACTPSCTGKTCGSDGCSGTCGGCPPSQICGTAQTCVASPSTTSIVVDAKSQGTVISSGIYGVAFSNDDSMQVAGLNRWGGDATSSYNWEADVNNSGTDWFCANYASGFKPPTPDPTLTKATDQFIHYNITEHADTLMTIPITGLVASAATPASALNALADCPDAVQGVWDSTKSGLCCSELGTSYAKKVDPTFMTSWVQHLVSTFGTAANGGVRYYQLDNEPDNWQALRKDIYPALYPPGTWCEPFYTTNASIGKSLNQDFIDRTMAYAKAVKAGDPTSKVLFMCTENAWDLVALPNVECGNPAGPYTVDNSLTKAILQLAATAQQTNGVRVLDCVDMHYPFPGNGLGDAQALWNPAVTQWSTPVIPPHVQGWINATYPGTGICVSEYNVPKDGQDGNAPDASSGAQLADILGMYGRLGYQAAAYWTTLVHNTTHLPVYNAMAMYRNYDGKGSRFGNVSIGAASPNAGVNVYASSDSATNPTKVWVMLVNVSTAAQSGLSITLQNFTSTTSAQVFRMAGGAAPAADAAVTVANGKISGLTVAQNSAVLLVLSK